MASPHLAQFDEPGGLSYADGILYVADTNNHVIRTIDLEAGVVDTIEFKKIREALIIDDSRLTILGGNAGDKSIIMAGIHQVATRRGRAELKLRPAGRFQDQSADRQ